jgi:hypothetical protein
MAASFMRRKSATPAMDSKDKGLVTLVRRIELNGANRSPARRQRISNFDCAATLLDASLCPLLYFDERINVMHLSTANANPILALPADFFIPDLRISRPNVRAGIEA